MGISLSILLVAVGAVLTWAVSAEVSGVDLTAVGVILMIVGGLGLLLSLVFWSSWGGFGGARDGSGGQNTTIVERDRT
ncbi:MAG: DUF6458 family protein [Gaiellaceae bacterium]